MTLNDVRSSEGTEEDADEVSSGNVRLSPRESPEDKEVLMSK
jgi:hypothetical protein